MTKKRPSSRHQKALLIHDANLTTVEQQENVLLEEISFTAHLCQEMIRFIQRGDPGRDDLHCLFGDVSKAPMPAAACDSLRTLAEGGGSI